MVHAEWVEVLGLGLAELVVVLVAQVVLAQGLVQVVLALEQAWPDSCWLKHRQLNNLCCTDLLIHRWDNLRNWNHLPICSNSN